MSLQTFEEWEQFRKQNCKIQCEGCVDKKTCPHGKIVMQSKKRWLCTRCGAEARGHREGGLICGVCGGDQFEQEGE